MGAPRPSVVVGLMVNNEDGPRVIVALMGVEDVWVNIPTGINCPSGNSIRSALTRMRPVMP